MVKKHNRTADVRDQLHKIKFLCSSLHPLLPEADQTRKLNVTATVPRVLKYITELQKEVGGLIRKKENLSRNSKVQGVLTCQEDQREAATQILPTVISTTQLTDEEVVIHISTYKLSESPLSDILLHLEKEGLLLLNASSFHSFEGMIFHSLHFKVERADKVECKLLSETLLSLYEKAEKVSP